MRRRTIAAFMVAVVAMGASSCAEPTRVITGDAQEALPRATLQDWVTYGDKLVVVKTTGETADPLTEEERLRGEGFSARKVTYEIQTTTWARSGSNQSLPIKIEAANGGWIVRGDKRTEVQFSGQAKAEIGASYLALLTYSDITAAVDPKTRKVTAGEGRAWTVIDLLPLSGGKVTSAGDEKQFPVRADLASLTPEESGARLGITDPDPVAEKYMNLDPVVRYQNVQLDKSAEAPPTPAKGER